VTDEGSSGLSGANREHPAAEADLDAALWPDPAGSPAMARPATRTLTTDSAPRRDSAPTRTARDRIRIERERDARRRRRIRVSLVSVGVLALAAGAAVIGVTSQHGKRSAAAPVHPAPFGYTGPYAPVTLNADNSVTMARPGVTKPVLDVFEDFQCATCRTFERSDGALIQQLAYQGKVKVVYYPFTVFTTQPQLGDSVRAWAAARCVPPNRWAKYHNALYANQPTQTASSGFPVSQLVRLGRDAGITGPTFVQCVQSQQYAMLDAPVSDQIINAGLSSMPDLTLNGKVIGASLTPSALRKLILAPSSDSGKPTPSKGA
jgi:protein-disulfide isomerase